MCGVGRGTVLILSLVFFSMLVIPVFFLAGTTQDESYYFEKCWVDRIRPNKVIFSDVGCEPNSAIERDLGVIKTVSQALPPMYSIELGDKRVPIHVWPHTGPIPYLIQNFFIYLGLVIGGSVGDKIGIDESDMNFIFSKLPALIGGYVTLAYVYKLSVFLNLNSMYPMIFLSSFLTFIYNSSIGIAVVYAVALSFVTMSIFYLYRGRRIYLIFVFFSVLSYLPTLILFLSLIVPMIRVIGARGVMIFFAVVLLSVLPYVISTVDIETSTKSYSYWIGLLPRSPGKFFYFFSTFGGSGVELIKNKIKWFFQDFFNFFGFRGSGNSFIVQEDYGVNYIYVFPYICTVLLGIKFLRRSTFFISLVVYMIGQVILFPFPNHPRRFYFALPLFSLILGYKSFSEGMKKILFAVHVMFQIILYAKMMGDFWRDGIFHITPRYDIQREVVKYLEREKMNKDVVSISAIINFPLLSSGKINIPDYIYLFSTLGGEKVFVQRVLQDLRLKNRCIIVQGEDVRGRVEDLASANDIGLKLIEKFPNEGSFKGSYYIFCLE